jgi:hypothetical protein
MSSNLPYKVVSVLVAMVLWLSILWGRKENILVKNVAYDLLLPRGYLVLEDGRKIITLRLAGPRATLRKVSQNLNHVTFEPATVNEGENLMVLHERALNLPSGVRLLSSDPEVVRFSVIKGELKEAR